MPSRFRQVNEVCLRRRKSRYTPGAKTAGPSPEKGDTGGAWILSAPNEENARRAFVLRRAILLPRAVEPMAPRLHPTFSGGLPPMADFRPGGQGRFGAFLRPQCRSRGASDPVPFRLPPDPHRGLCSGQPHSILGHDSLSGPVSPQSHSYHTRFPRKSQRSAPCKTALYCRTAKNRRSGAESPCCAGKKDV